MILDRQQLHTMNLWCTGVLGLGTYECGGNLDPMGGQLGFPGFVEEVDHNCSLSLLFNSTKQLTLTFHYFEARGNGDWFRVRVRDPLYGEAFVPLYEANGSCISGSAVCPSGVHMSVLASEVLIIFESGSGGVAPGFNISYNITEPGILSLVGHCRGY